MRCACLWAAIVLGLMIRGPEAVAAVSARCCSRAR
jgi:hypothetical protein